MHNKNMNYFEILTFNKNNYSKIIKRIKVSRLYLTFINVGYNSGLYINPRYTNYLKLKEAVYGENINRPKNPDTDNYTYHFYTSLKDNNITQEQKSKFLDKYKIKDDYKYTIETKEKNFDSYLAIHEITLLENVFLEEAKKFEIEFDNLNKKNLRKEFSLNKYKRFTLIPFLAKYNGEYVSPYISINVYDIGIITLQVSISFNDKNRIITEDIPRNMILENVELITVKESYNSDDFADKKYYQTKSVDDILKHYSSIIIEVCNNLSVQNAGITPVFWMVNDLNHERNLSHEQFIKNNRDYYIYHLLNAPKQIVDRIKDDDKEQLLKDSLLVDVTGMSLFSNKTGTLLSLSHMSFRDINEANINNRRNELSDEEIKEYIEYQNTINTRITLVSFIRFYEMTFIQKYFFENIFNELVQNNIENSEKLLNTKNQIIDLRLQYDSENIFNSEGSPKETYNLFMESTGTNELKNKINSLFNEYREYIDDKNSREMNLTNNYILIIGSILTILFSYSSIEAVVINILGNINKIGKFFLVNAELITIILWIIVVTIIISLNLQRYRQLKDK